MRKTSALTFTTVFVCDDTVGLAAKSTVTHVANILWGNMPVWQMNILWGCSSPDRSNVLRWSSAELGRDAD